MKRFAVMTAVILVLVLLSGCCSTFIDVLRGNTHAPTNTPQETLEIALPTDETAEPTPAPAENGVEYVSANLGIAFTLPASWAGKFRVQENDSSLSVYFAPETPIDEGMGKFFTIMRMTDGDEDSFFDDSKVFQINGVSFVFGGPTDVTYSDGDPEYDTFVEMQNDLPAIFQSIKAAP